MHAPADCCCCVEQEALERRLSAQTAGQRCAPPRPTARHTSKGGRQADRQQYCTLPCSTPRQAVRRHRSPQVQVRQVVGFGPSVSAMDRGRRAAQELDWRRRRRARAGRQSDAMAPCAAARVVGPKRARSSLVPVAVAATRCARYRRRRSASALADAAAAAACGALAHSGASSVPSEGAGRRDAEEGRVEDIAGSGWIRRASGSLCAPYRAGHARWARGRDGKEEALCSSSSSSTSFSCRSLALNHHATHRDTHRSHPSLPFLFQGELVDLYVPRKCAATGRIIEAKDHASVQIAVADVDESGRAIPGSNTTFALGGHVRRAGESDDSLNRLATEQGREYCSAFRFSFSFFSGFIGCRAGAGAGPQHGAGRVGEGNTQTTKHAPRQSVPITPPP